MLPPAAAAHLFSRLQLGQGEQVIGILKLVAFPKPAEVPDDIGDET